MNVDKIEYFAAAFIIVLIIGFTYIFVAYPHKQKVISEYFEIFGGLSLIFLIITYIVNAYKSKKTQEATLVLTKREDELKSIFSFDKLYIKYYPYLNRLYSQFHPNLHITEPKNINKEKRDNIEIFACTLFLNYLNNLYVENKPVLQRIKSEVLRYFKSQILLRVWENESNAYPKDFNNFIHDVIISEIKNNLS